MNSRIIQTYYRLINSLKIETHRFLYNDFNINRRLTGIIGPRGTGKTTLMLQFIKNFIKNIDEAIYVSLDNIFFQNVSLYDFVEDLYEVENTRIFFLDEVHKYLDWNQEIKNIYDSFPDIKIIFSGSSSIDLMKGHYDLSRRGYIYNLPGLSFREYINFKTNSDFLKIPFNELLENHIQISQQYAQVPKIRGIFKEYIEKGYYPFIFEEETTYFERIMTVLEKTVYEDIANFYSLKTTNLHNFKKLMAYFAFIEPGKLNINNISRNMGIDNKTIHNYISILCEVGLLTNIPNNLSGLGSLRGSDKIYLNNTNLYYAIRNEIGKDVMLGTIRENFFISMAKNAAQKVFHVKSGDFQISDFIFKIGGKNKSKKQIKGIENSFVVKDDILIASSGVIPLYLLEFLY